jgi:hypothetical protein
LAYDSCYEQDRGNERQETASVSSHEFSFGFLGGGGWPGKETLDVVEFCGKPMLVSTEINELHPLNPITLGSWLSYLVGISRE